MKERIIKSIKKFAEKKPRTALAIAGGIIVFIGLVLYFYFTRENLAPYDFYTVAKSDLTEQVEAQGVVKPTSAVDLAFPKSAVIAGVYVKEGDRVYRGSPLASLANADLQVSLEQAEANLRAERAKLSTMEGGDRPEDLQAKETAVAQAKSVLLDKIHGAYTASDDAIHNQTILLFTNSRSVNPEPTFSFPDSALRISLQNQRVELEKALARWNESVLSLNSSTDPISGGYSEEATQNLRLVAVHLDSLAASLSKAIPDAVNTNAQIAQYRSTVSLARTNVNLASSALVSAVSAETSSESALHLAQAGSLPGDVEAERARVAQAEASVNAVKVNIGQTSITSPLDGTVTRVDAKVGAVAQANNPLISVISGGQYQIDTYVSQIDIGKIQVGNKAVVTLDAYGNTTPFDATVIYVGNGNTQIGGAASYKVTLQFDKIDDKVKQGMNANITLFTSKKSAVLSVPKDSILLSNGESYVQVETEKGLIRKKVETGIVGNNGLIEIKAGLSLGEFVASFNGITQ